MRYASRDIETYKAPLAAPAAKKATWNVRYKCWMWADGWGAWKGRVSCNCSRWGIRGAQIVIE